ncbi:MAG: hypothetical protein GEV05_24295 [Betaproteobacteria bacterium]|nr:hypothetical protein [Betaproteobacteria bacterium]
MQAFIFKCGWALLLLFCIAPFFSDKPYLQPTGKVIETPTLPVDAVLEASERLYWDRQRGALVLEKTEVAEFVPDNIMDRYREPKTKRSQDWEGFKHASSR